MFKCSQGLSSLEPVKQPSKMATIFDKTLKRYTISLLSQIALDYNLPKDEVLIKFMGAPKVVDPATQCTVITAKKTQCTRKCLPGQSVCGVHTKKETPVPIPAPVFIRKDDPGPSLSIDERIKAIMESDDDDEEPDSPGGVRHKIFLKYKARGVTWEMYHSEQWSPHLQTLEQRLEFLATRLAQKETTH